jgi:hypothetical protein
MEKKQIAKLLHSQSNISATSGELVQFFRSDFYNGEEDDEGNIIEDFLEWRGDNIQTIEEARQYYENSMKLLSKQLTPSKPLPKKVIKALEEQQKELDKLFKEEL